MNCPALTMLMGAGLEFIKLARKVLVVDDDPLVLDITVSMLEDIGCEVVAASNAKEALEKLSDDQQIDILMTDINMPGMDGYELANAALQRHARLKIIVLSGREDDGHGLPLIRKPFNQEDLRKTMLRHTHLC